MVEISSPESLEVSEVLENAAESQPEWQPAVGIKQVFFSPMAWLNVAWPGLGNIVIGDMRGWLYGLATWIFVFLSLFTFGIPLILFWGFCCYRGYEYAKSNRRKDWAVDATRCEDTEL